MHKRMNEEFGEIQRALVNDKSVCNTSGRERERGSAQHFHLYYMHSNVLFKLLKNVKSGHWNPLSPIQPIIVYP